jgi:hypothetical protein
MQQLKRQLAFQSQDTMQAISVVSVMMRLSKMQIEYTVAERPSSALKPLSLPHQLPELPFLVGSGPLSLHSPQLPDLPFTLRRVNAVRYPALVSDTQRLSATISTQADITTGPYHHLSMSRPRVWNPLANEKNYYMPQGQVTFDTFPAPHRSGKGNEACRGGHHAKL